jgi:putative peptidoglycan lipid II flippase
VTEAPGGAPQRRSSARGALTLMGGTLASRLSGLLREVLLVALFPVRASDAFRLAWTVPNLFRELLAEGALTNAFIPIYQRLRGDDRRDFAGAMAAMLALINGVLVALALLAAPALVDLLLAEGANVDRDLAVLLLRIAFPTLAAISLAALAMGVLNAEERFLAPAWAPVALNVVAIAAMLAVPGQAVVLAWGVVAGGVAQAAVQWPAMRAAGVAPRLGRLWHAAMPMALALMAPFAFTTGARQFLNVVAQRIVSDATLFPPGAVTAYALSAMLFSLALGLFAISPAVAYFSRLGNVVAEGGTAFEETLEEGVRFIVLLSAPAGLALYAFAEPSVRVVFELLAPAAGQDTTIELAVLAIAPLGLALVPAGLVNFLLRPFFVRGRVLAPVALSVAFTVATAGLFVVLAPRYGIAGLSWSTAAAMALQTLVLLGWLARAERLNLRTTLTYLARVALAALAAVALARAAATATLTVVPLAGWSQHLTELVVGAAVLVAVYALVGIGLGIVRPERFRRSP